MAATSLLGGCKTGTSTADTELPLRFAVLSLTTSRDLRGSGSSGDGAARPESHHHSEGIGGAIHSPE